MSISVQEIMEEGLINSIRDIEEALRNNVDYPSDRQRYEVTMSSIKDKKGWFTKIIRKHVKNRLEKGNFKSPKVLNKNSRKFLEDQLKKYKEKLEILKIERNGAKNK